MKYQILIQEIVKNVGGKKNIITVTHCMTRLRLTLRDNSSVDTDNLKNIQGVLGVVSNQSQCQIIVGTKVGEIYKELITYAGLDSEKESVVSNSRPSDGGGKNKLASRIMKNIADCVLPAIPALIGSGILKGILAALKGFGLMSADSGTYMILYGAADSLYYFFPIIIGFCAAKVFGISQSMGAVIGAALVYPNLVAAESLSFMGIPVIKATYSNTIFPIIVAVFFASYVDKAVRKIIPDLLKTVFVPAITLAVTVPVTFIVIGPLVNVVSDGVMTVINTFFNLSPAIAGLLLGGLWQVLVMFGIHQAVIPLIIQEIATVGYSYIDACAGISLFGIAGMALGYSLRIKNKAKKAENLGHFLVAMCGVTEPAIYAIGVPNLKLFACACAGSGIGGLVMAIFGGKAYGFGGSALFKAPTFIGPEGIGFNLVLFAICTLLTVGAACIFSYIVTGKNNNSKE